MNALEFDHVTFAYGDSAPALDDVCIAVSAGERVALLGPNGAGKTTLLFVATGFLRAQKGTVHVGGTALSPRTLSDARRKLALLFADPDDQIFCPTVFDEVAFAPRQRRESESHIGEVTSSLLETVGLRGYDAREPLLLSLGEKKRVALAAALATEAPLLLLDEPTSGLDARGRRRILDALSSLAPAMVLATHDLDAARSLDARAIVMDQGRIVADGPARVLLEDGELLDRHGLR